MKFKCLRKTCQHAWVSRLEDGKKPVACPRCHSPNLEKIAEPCE